MSKHRKVILLIILNALISFVLLIVTDYIFFKYIYNGYINSLNEKHKLEETDGHIRYKTFDFNIDDFHTTNVYNVFLEKKYYHDVIIPDKYNGKKAPIVLFGDSYTWLYPDTGLQKLLAEYTKRPVFNFAFWGWGAQHMYYLTQKDLLYKIINSENFEKNPEYIVYTYIRDHKNRLYSVMDYFLDIKPYLTYEKTNDKLKIKEYSFFHKLLFRLFLYRYFLNEHKNYDNTLLMDMEYYYINAKSQSCELEDYFISIPKKYCKFPE